MFDLIKKGRQGMLGGDARKEYLDYKEAQESAGQIALPFEEWLKRRDAPSKDGEQK